MKKQTAVVNQRKPVSTNYAVKRASVKTARFDAKISITQKTKFEYASAIGGFRSLTDFVLSSAEEKAQSIIRNHETILATERDRKVFFDAILNPPAPNSALIEATKEYNARYESK